MSTLGYNRAQSPSENPMLLAGDIGGTKTLLGIFSSREARPLAVRVETFTTAEFDGLGSMIAAFLARPGLGRSTLEAACFGVAGPVINQVARLTNIPWAVDGAEIARRFSVPRVRLLNDLEAMAHSVPVLEPSELAVLQAGRPVPTGSAALIAAGTGLGEAILHNVGGRLVPSPSEGGHADFAARTPEEIALLQTLTRLYGRVDCERVISGPGLVNIHGALHTDGCRAVGPGIEAHEAPAAISRAALEGRCPRCVDTLRLFVAAYGAEAGNLALYGLATAGVYVGGGIAPKILPALESGPFIDAFRAKEPMADLLASIPVSVILNPQAGLLGASVHANRLARQQADHS
jgi:glucokinase